MLTITKGLARKMFNEGKEILVMPNCIRPSSYAWKKLALWVVTTGQAGEFDKLCELVSYYNCNPKNGMELTFYAKEASI